MGRIGGIGKCAKIAVDDGEALVIPPRAILGDGARLREKIVPGRRRPSPAYLLRLLLVQGRRQAHDVAPFPVKLDPVLRLVHLLESDALADDGLQTPPAQQLEKVSQVFLELALILLNTLAMLSARKIGKYSA